MPASVQIGAIALGGVLVLIGLVGGNFKLFGAELAATISNSYLRFVAFAFGTFLIIAALNSSGSTPTPSPSPISYPTPGPTPTPTPVIDPEASTPVNINGTWENQSSTSNVIQNGKWLDIKIDGTSDDGNRYVGEGTGTINGRNFRYNYNAKCLCGGWNSEGSVIGTVSEDGNSILYTIKDSYWGPIYNVSAQKL
jgi:hypothetical protein